MTNYEKLTELHAKKNPQALGTSSAAIVHSLGYEDGEKMPFDELLYLVGRIVKNVTVPVSVDVEMGYGLNGKEITSNLQELSKAGVALLGVPHPLEESLVRLKLYENAGADGLFVPGIVSESDISRVVQASSLPINVMCVPNLPSFGRLAELGVKRISMGNFLFENLYAMLSATVQKLIREDSFKSIY